MTDGAAQTAEFASAMRSIMQQARWHPEDDPATVIATLTRMHEGVGALVTTKSDALTIFEDDTLGEIYVLCAAIHKTIDQQHPAQHPDHRAMSAATFIQEVRRQFPHFHERQQTLLARLNAQHPPKQ